MEINGLGILQPSWLCLQKTCDRQPFRIHAGLQSPPHAFPGPSQAHPHPIEIGGKRREGSNGEGREKKLSVGDIWGGGISESSWMLLGVFWEH
eukprot:8378-Pyramimonas_sp.AAC.1